MREILFRGKRLDNGEWVYGDLVHVENKSYISYYYESPLSTFINELIEYVDMSMVGVAPFIEVDLTTIGQYTGLTDKNGKKIFEGDIVVVPLSGKPAKGIVEYFKTDICGFAVITQPQYSNYVLQKNYAYEVIGNIHDNPELLEVDK